MLRRVHLPRRRVAGARRGTAPPSRSAARLDLRAGAHRARHIGGRAIDYSFDPAGYRVRRVDEPVDLTRPTILFIGESVMFGEGLTWEESVPAQVGAMMGIQSANLAVHGFGSDQAYLRLQTELPRFRRPVAVVSLFMTALFGRNLDDDRPHLGPGLVGFPQPEATGRLASIAKLLVPYRSDETIERGVLDHARGAARHVAWRMRAGRRRSSSCRIRRGSGAGSGRCGTGFSMTAACSYVWVEIDAAWRLPWDRHPNPRAAQAIAAAVTASACESSGGARRRLR